MKHLIKKNKLTINGAGFGGGPKSGPPPPPPSVTQYPSVLAPPQMGNVASVSSFSYAELIDLISDGPIEGLVNKNGKKIYEENIFEGIYLNDSPIKETSSTKTQKISIDFLKRSLKDFWSDNKNCFKTKSITTPDTLTLNVDGSVDSFNRVLSVGSSNIDIDNANFDSGIKITSYAPKNSAYNFIKILGASFDAQALLDKTFNLSPIENENIFLTSIEIPKFTIFINKTFDPTEGGSDGRYPLKISIPNLGNYIYFSIGSDSLTSFNYFEMPRSYAENGNLTPAGQKTFLKTLVNSTNYYQYDVFNLRLFIWSIYSETDGIKNIDNILDKYFNNLIIYQNDPSLYNYNLVQAEFKNGAEIQTPLKAFNRIEIENNIGKELIGPFKLKSQFSVLEEGIKIYEGVTRLTNLSADANSKPSYSNVPDSSDDIRYVKAWPVEYTTKGACPYLICNLYMNYSTYDKTSSARTCQNAVPVTHYVANENVEEVYVTLSLEGLYDTAHVDMASDNKTKGFADVNKFNQTIPALPGTKTWAQIQKNDYIVNCLKDGYFLIAGTINDGYIIDQSDILANIFCNIKNSTSTNSNYFSAIKSSIGLCTKISNIDTYITSSSAGLGTAPAKYDLTTSSPLRCWTVPNDACYTKESICINGYIGNPDAFEAKLKSKNIDGTISYQYGLSDREILVRNGTAFLTAATTPANSPGNVVVAKYQYYTAPTSELKKRATVGLILNSYINYGAIFKFWNSATNSVLKDRTNTIDNLNILYPNIQRYIVDPFLRYWSSQVGATSYTQQVASVDVIKNLYLVGFNKHYLDSQTLYFESNGKLKLSILDQLLEDYVLKSPSGLTNSSSIEGESKITDIAFTSGLQENLIKFEGGKLIGFSSIFLFQKVSDLGSLTVLDNSSETNPNSIRNIENNRINIFLINSDNTTFNYNFYDSKNIFIINEGYVRVNENFDVAIFYQLYSNVSSSINTQGLDLPQYKVQTRDSSGNDLTPTNANFGNAVQNITAGTRLPAVVKVQVETGYESKERINCIGPNEYFKYFFEIFGMSTQQSYIDLGRKTYDFVYGERGSFDSGGYVSKTTNIYYPNKKLYLLKVTLSPSGTAQPPKFYLTDNKEIGFADLGLTYAEQDINKGIYEILENSKVIGLKQEIDTAQSVYGTTAIQKYVDLIFTAPLVLNNFTLTDTEVSNYFNNTYEEIDFGRADTFLRKIINTNKILPDGIFTVENYANSYAEFSSSEKNFDTYMIYEKSNVNKFIKIELYNYDYTTFEIVDVPTEEQLKSYLSINYYIAFYFEEFVGYRGNTYQPSLYETLQAAFANDVIIKLPALETNPAVSQITSSISAKWNKGNFIIRISKTAITNPTTGIAEFTTNDAVFGTLDSPPDSSFKINLSNHINAYLSDEILLDEINSKIILNKNFLTRADGTKDTLDFEFVKNYFKDKTWLYQHKRSDIIYESLARLGLKTTSIKTGAVKHVTASASITVPSVDLRYRGSLVKGKLEPIFFQGSFFVIKNNNNNKISLILNNADQASNYENFNNSLKGINLYDYINQSNIQTVSVTNDSFSGATQQWKTRYETKGNMVLSESYSYELYTPARGGRVCAWSVPVENRYGNPFFAGATYWTASLAYEYLNFDKNQKMLADYAYKDTAKKARWVFSSLSDGTAIFYQSQYWNAGFDNPSPRLVMQGVGRSTTPTAETDYGFISHYQADFVYGGYIDGILDQRYAVITPTLFNATFKNDAFVNSTRIVTDDYVAGNSSILYDVENVLQRKSIIKRDVKIKNYILFASMTKIAATANKNIEIFYFENVPFSNIDSDSQNTFANDAGLSIKLPAPKYYSDGTPLRRYVKVTKMSYETLSPLISKKIALSKITEIIPQKFSYPFSSMVGMKIDSRAFSQIPTRTYDCKLKKILVPSNYFPNDEDGEDVRYMNGTGKYKIYEGDWDGTFKLMWTNNPAWILMDMLVNKRYGLGNYISSDQIDIWELYKIARWCDGVDDNGYYYGVPDSYGGTEPRHAFNGIITDKFNVFDMINQIASIFRGHVYYMNSMITFDDDRLKPIIGEFNNSDVKDGIFNYTNHKKDDEFTAVEVAYIDEKDNYKPKIEYVEDSDGIRKRGILKKQINAFGVTSKGQARRLGLHFLFQTSKENMNVSFTTDMKALLYKPGDLIGINDELFNSYRNFGRVEKIENINNDKFKITVSPTICDAFLDTSEVTLYTARSKPKYEDILSSVESYPCQLKIQTNNVITKRFDNSYVNKEYVFNVTQDKDLINQAYCYTGNIIFDYSNTPKVTKNLQASLKYVKNYDMNNNYSVKYGHWRLATGNPDSLYQDLYLFDSVSDLICKNTNQKKQYFFSMFDSGKYLRYTGVNLLNEPLYEYSSFSLTGNTREPFKISINNSLGYSSGLISYSEIIENDRPSIENFKIITGYHYPNDGYSELEISKSGWNYLNNNFERIKESVVDGIGNLVTGSPFSLKIKNINQPIFKIMSITENYINEYNLLATEYNPDKFKLIEENASIDDLNSTFNFISAYNSKNNNSIKDSLLKAPIFKSLKYVKDDKYFKKYLNIQWAPANSDPNLIYQVFIKTPSKQTNNHTISNIGINFYNEINNEYEVNFDLQNANFEIGTYEVSIFSSTRAFQIVNEQFYFIESTNFLNKISNMTSKSILILEY